MTTMSDRWKSAEQDLDRLLSALGVDSVDAAVARVEALQQQVAFLLSCVKSGEELSDTEEWQARNLLAARPTEEPQR